MADYVIREDVLMALTGDITDCTIEEFIARLRDKLSKLPSVSVDDVINQRATTCRHGGHCEWVACDKCNHYEPELANASQDLVKQLESLESEYNAYHLDKNDYWRGVKHAIEVLKFRQA